MERSPVNIYICLGRCAAERSISTGSYTTNSNSLGGRGMGGVYNPIVKQGQGGKWMKAMWSSIHTQGAENAWAFSDVVGWNQE